MYRSIAILVLLGLPLAASTLKVSPNSAVRATSETEGIYASTHLYIDEIAADSVPITIFFDAHTTGVQTCEVFTNLNRRERADDDADGDGIEDGIKPVAGSLISVGSDAHYYKAHTMNLVPGEGYQLTLNLTKTGVYRINVRWRLNTDAPGVWRYYTSDPSTTGQFGDLNFRAYTVVASPKKARDIVMYGVNPLTTIATGIGPGQRGTFADLAGGVSGGAGTPRFNLDYVKGLGANMLWFQPIHPNGIDGRQIDPATSQPLEVGSPYAVRNFFEVMPLMAKAFTAGSTPATNEACPLPI